MSKSKNAKIAPANDVQENPTEALANEAKDVSAAETKAPAAPKTRGPRGTEESAKITLIATSNPKRPNSKAFGVFAQYKDQMTVKEFCDLVGKEATGHLVYDAKHGSISIEGYDPGAIVVAKVKVPKEPKAPKEKKGKKEVVVKTIDENRAALEQETQQETME